jgi:hypothetical protein
MPTQGRSEPRAHRWHAEFTQWLAALIDDAWDVSVDTLDDTSRIRSQQLRREGADALGYHLQGREYHGVGDCSTLIAA